ncbi:SH3 domain-containing protein, partial [Leptospira koniambonensis]
SILFLIIPSIVIGDEIVVIGKIVNIRENPSISGKVIASVAIGDSLNEIAETATFEVIDNRRAKWYKVSKNNIIGWIFGGYTSKFTSLNTEDLIKIGRELVKRNPIFAKNISKRILSEPSVELHYGPDTISSHGEGKTISRIADCYISGFQDFESADKNSLIENIRKAVQGNDAKLLASYGSCDMSGAICNSGVWFDSSKEALISHIFKKISTHNLKVVIGSQSLEYTFGDKSLQFEFRKTDVHNWNWTGVCFSNNIFD